MDSDCWDEGRKHMAFLTGIIDTIHSSDDLWEDRRSSSQPLARPSLGNISAATAKNIWSNMSQTELNRMKELRDSLETLGAIRVSDMVDSVEEIVGNVCGRSMVKDTLEIIDENPEEAASLLAGELLTLYNYHFQRDSGGEEVIVSRNGYVYKEMADSSELIENDIPKTQKENVLTERKTFPRSGNVISKHPSKFERNSDSKLEKTAITDTGSERETKRTGKIIQRTLRQKIDKKIQRQNLKSISNQNCLGDSKPISNPISRRFIPDQQFSQEKQVKPAMGGKVDSEGGKEILSPASFEAKEGVEEPRPKSVMSASLVRKRTDLLSLAKDLGIQTKPFRGSMFANERARLAMLEKQISGKLKMTEDPGKMTKYYTRKMSSKLDMDRIPQKDQRKTRSHKVNVPKVSVAKVPKVNIPKVPKVNVPKVNVLRVNVLKGNVPKVNAPKVNVPKVNSSKVNVPKVLLKTKSKTSVKETEDINTGSKALTDDKPSKCLSEYRNFGKKSPKSEMDQEVGENDAFECSACICFSDTKHDDQNFNQLPVSQMEPLPRNNSSHQLMPIRDKNTDLNQNGFSACHNHAVDETCYVKQPKLWEIDISDETISRVKSTFIPELADNSNENEYTPRISTLVENEAIAQSEDDVSEDSLANDIKAISDEGESDSQQMSCDVIPERETDSYQYLYSSQVKRNKMLASKENTKAEPSIYNFQNLNFQNSIPSFPPSGTSILSFQTARNIPIDSLQPLKHDSSDHLPKGPNWEPHNDTFKLPEYRPSTQVLHSVKAETCSDSLHSPKLSFQQIAEQDEQCDDLSNTDSIDTDKAIGSDEVLDSSNITYSDKIIYSDDDGSSHVVSCLEGNASKTLSETNAEKNECEWPEESIEKLSTSSGCEHSSVQFSLDRQIPDRYQSEEEPVFVFACHREEPEEEFGDGVTSPYGRNLFQSISLSKLSALNGAGEVGEAWEANSNDTLLVTVNGTDMCKTSISPQPSPVNTGDPWEPPNIEEDEKPVLKADNQESIKKGFCIGKDATTSCQVVEENCDVTGQRKEVEELPTKNPQISSDKINKEENRRSPFSLFTSRSKMAVFVLFAVGLSSVALFGGDSRQLFTTIGTTPVKYPQSFISSIMETVTGWIL